MQSSLKRLVEQLDNFKGERKRSTEGFISVVDEISDEGIDWHTVESPRRLRRVFVIDDRDVRSSFIVALIDYFSHVKSYPKILIDGKKVIIDVYTPGINDVTALDRESALKIDEIFIDSQSSANKSELSFERYTR